MQAHRCQPGEGVVHLVTDTLGVVDTGQRDISGERFTASVGPTGG